MRNFFKRLFGLGSGTYADADLTDSTMSEKPKAGAVMSLLRRLAGLGAKANEPRVLSHRTYSARDRMRPVDVVSVRHKLGASFFSRRLNPRYRARLLRSLTVREAEIAREHSWLPPIKRQPARGGKHQDAKGPQA